MIDISDVGPGRGHMLRRPLAVEIQLEKLRAGRRRGTVAAASGEEFELLATFPAEFKTRRRRQSTVCRHAYWLLHCGPRRQLTNAATLATPPVFDHFR